ncbi:MAG TPA: hypothetical protein DCZ95_19120 [Verrucomicrobia bacterium]|nr:hypothetical protein [Verrucomicrobiota bacterium]
MDVADGFPTAMVHHSGPGQPLFPSGYRLFAFDQAIAMSDAFPRSRVEVITQRGHSPMWEKPSEFALTVVEFLQEVITVPG